MILVLAACSPPEATPSAEADVVFACDEFECVEGGDVTVGDVEAGRIAMVDEGYATCGVPVEIFDQIAFLYADDARIPGRTGEAADYPYDWAIATSVRGNRVANKNCFFCHAGFLDGALVLGMPDPFRDHTDASSAGLTALEALAETDAEREELAVAAALAAVSDDFLVDTVGANSGNFIAMAVAAYRDPATHAWLGEPHMELPPSPPVPYDVPPWWNTKYKHGLYANTAARGDFTAFLASPAHTCSESAEEAAALLAKAPDMTAWIFSLEPPAWPYAVDADLAADGREIFLANCARCHGTYGDSPEYPNVVVPVATVGTDPWAADEQDTWQRAWDEHFAINAYGEGTSWAPQAGYIAPPLWGIWASAPYFHNGMVPTLVAVIDPEARPDLWRFAEDQSYDTEAAGWAYETLTTSKAETPEDERVHVHDASERGYSNQGHLFGAHLSDDEVGALVAYLVTL